MACLIENIENDMDPMLDPVLEKSYEQVGRNKKLKLGDADIQWDDNFRL
jgi:dynein heavy chain